MIRLSVRNQEGEKIDEIRLMDDAWHVLMPATLGQSVTDLARKHNGNWFKIDIEVL